MGDNFRGFDKNDPFDGFKPFIVFGHLLPQGYPCSSCTSFCIICFAISYL